MSENNPITLHWFLPTYGDSRGITAGGHGFGFHSGSRTAQTSITFPKLPWPLNETVLNPS
ncbi:hypothetical protein KaCgl_27780 [Corynebacterium glutamicum]|nr:coenzyme F420-dependent N5,N10-methylene tetrahydromethanopterin reductase and related flavin-dependent oxidoreductases [Corynebacterium glutamicum]BCB34804.1 hypothetical protein KaCgl_27780 [Corynebacterium glutamicum]